MQNGINMTGFTRWGYPNLATGGIKTSEKSQPFVNPDVFRPAYPTGPEPSPDFPYQPMKLPTTPGPFVEVPHEFPIELPPFPNADEWKQIPTPQEIPDWAEFPLEFPQPDGMRIELPNKGPDFPHVKLPDGNWVLS